MTLHLDSTEASVPDFQGSAGTQPERFLNFRSAGTQPEVSRGSPEQVIFENTDDKTAFLKIIEKIKEKSLIFLQGFFFNSPYGVCSL